MKIFKGIEDQTKYQIIITPECPIKDRLDKEVRHLEWHLIGQNEHWTLNETNYKRLLKIIEEERLK